MKHYVDYTNSNVYKIFLKRKTRELLVTPEQALNIIEQVHHLSAGLPQVVYLVGWQHDGHDSKYPDLSVVNPAFKRAGDASAVDSVRWVMREAREKFGARVSVHINFDDAYQSSPLWQAYFDANVLIRDEKGELEAGGWWDGERAYHINKTAELKAGLLQRRLDGLLDILPIREAGTIHIDTFRPHASPAQGVSYDDDLATCLKIADYLHGCGIDITSEFVGDYALAGPIAWTWAYNFDELGRMTYPRSLVAGGHNGWNHRQWSLRRGIPAWAGGSFVPAAGTRFANVWGMTAAQDLIAIEGSDDFKTPASYAADFYRHNVACHFLDAHPPLEHRMTRDRYEVRSTDNVVSHVDIATGRHQIHHGDRLVFDDGDYLLPAMWAGPGRLIAYCHSGNARDWTLAAGAGSAHSARRLGVGGAGTPQRLSFAGGAITVPAEAGVAWLISPE